MAETRFDSIKANTEIGTLTIHTNEGDVKFGMEDFSDKTLDITTLTYDDTQIQQDISQLEERVSSLEGAEPFDPTSLEESIAQIQSGKQDKLVSGTSIKTINGNSILGSGNLEIQGGGSSSSAITTEQVEEIVSEQIDDVEDSLTQSIEGLEGRIDTIDLRTGNMGSMSSYNVSILTQDQYDALQEKDSHTFYFIVDEPEQNDNDDE